MHLNCILRRWRLFLFTALAIHGFYTSLQRRMTIDFWRRARSVKASMSDCEKVRNITLTNSLESLEPDDFRRHVNKLGHCPWQYSESEHNKLRLELQNCCNARSMLLTTKQNAPLGTLLYYETNPEKNITMTEEIHRMLPKDPPFLKKPFETCAVVGNGGILLNSFCGEQIDGMDYVFRLNLPPLTMAEHIGMKTDFVTCNPSILRYKYERLFSRRKPFINHLKNYGPAMVVLPAFAYVSSTEVSFRVFYSVEEFQLKNKVVFYHPNYLSNISSYWVQMGVEARRLSSGIMIVTAALELCNKVTLYGFWPFSRDPEGSVILHHYYDNTIPKPGFHAMNHEFFIYTKMHSKGVLYLQVGKC